MSGKKGYTNDYRCKVCGKILLKGELRECDIQVMCSRRQCQMLYDVVCRDGVCKFTRTVRRSAVYGVKIKTIV